MAKASQVQAHVVSSTPGRLRVRLHGPERGEKAAQKVREELGKRGVEHVRTNARTGSIVVHFDRRRRSPHDVLAALEDAGVVVTKTVEDLVGLPSVGPSITARQVTGSLDDLDRRLSRLTGRRVDLKLLFPLSLAALGLRQTLTVGLGLSQVPGYLLLWYAFDAFLRFNRQPPGGEHQRQEKPDERPAPEPKKPKTG
ncbi:MAG: HMA2 domain-containing protein [Chloroflexota bacterium]